MDEQVLDASAVLALRYQEPGWQLVADVQHRLVSSVNLAETLSKLIDRGHSPEDAEAALALLRLRVIPFDEAQAAEAARLRPLTRAFGLSLGDRACLALARVRGLPVLTADRTSEHAAPHVSIRSIR